MQNRAIGEVEGGKMPVADVEVDHIDHKAMPQAIEQVAQRAADNQRVGNIVQLCVAFERYISCVSTTQMPDRDRKEPALPAAAVGEELKAAHSCGHNAD